MGHGGTGAHGPEILKASSTQSGLLLVGCMKTRSVSPSGYPSGGQCPLRHVIHRGHSITETPITIIESYASFIKSILG